MIQIAAIDAGALVHGDDRWNSVYRFVVPASVNAKARHPPQSGWLDELGRLKGGHLLGLSVALKRALVSSFTTVGLFRPRFLCAECSGSKADRGDGPAAGLRTAGPTSWRTKSWSL